MTIETRFQYWLSEAGRLPGNAAERFFWDEWSDTTNGNTPQGSVDL
jgi:hypothetical protein